MRVKNITIYEAYDGKEFDTEQECIDYENNNEEIMKARESARVLRDFCQNHNRNCYSCIFYNNNFCKFDMDSPAFWENI